MGKRSRRPPPISGRLRQLRETRVKKTAKDFAAQLGINNSTYLTYETLREPPMSVIHQVVQATRCNPLWLLTGLGKPDAPADPEEVKLLASAARQEEDATTWIREFALELLRMHLKVSREQNDRLLRENARLRVSLEKTIEEKGCGPMQRNMVDVIGRMYAEIDEAAQQIRDLPPEKKRKRKSAAKVTL